MGLQISWMYRLYDSLRTKSLLFGLEAILLYRVRSECEILTLQRKSSNISPNPFLTLLSPPITKCLFNAIGLIGQQHAILD